jgi:hypothetical protein
MMDAGKERLVRGFQNVLNSHGYGFQYSVLKEVARLAYEVRSASWIPKVPEFPVEVQGHDTRIDFILKHARLPFYLVAECKRANPSLANWCFAKMDITPSADIFRVEPAWSQWRGLVYGISNRLGYQPILTQGRKDRKCRKEERWRKRRGSA